MQCDSGPSFPAWPLIQDDGLLRREIPPAKPKPGSSGARFCAARLSWRAGLLIVRMASQTALAGRPDSDLDPQHLASQILLPILETCLLKP